MEKQSYINSVETYWKDTGLYERCTSILSVIKELVDPEDRLNNYFIPWNPFAYGPKLGVNDARFIKDTCGNDILKDGGDSTIFVSPDKIRINVSGKIYSTEMVDITDMSIIDIKNKLITMMEVN